MKTVEDHNRLKRDKGTASAGRVGAALVLLIWPTWHAEAFFKPTTFVVTEAEYLCSFMAITSIIFKQNSHKKQEEWNFLILYKQD